MSAVLTKITPLYLDLPDVALATSMSTAVIEKMVRDGLFPKPRLLSKRRVGWLYAEVATWCQERPVSDLAPPPNTGRRRKAESESEPA